MYSDTRRTEKANNLRKSLIKLKKKSAVVFVDSFIYLKFSNIIFNQQFFLHTYSTVQAVSFKKSLSLSQSITLAPPEILALKKVNAFHVTHAQTMHRRIDKKGEPFLILMAYFQN